MNKEQLVSCLSNEKVYVKFYRRRKGNATIDNPKHVANGGMLDTATKEFVPPRLRNGQLKNILTDSEKAFLEDFMNLPEGTLSIYNKEFWNKRKVILTKDDNIFDLSNPEHYINLKILEANSNKIAPSLDVIGNKQTYWFYIERSGEGEKRAIKNLTSKQEAYKLFGKYEEDIDVLRYILKEAAKPTAKNTKLVSLQAWVGSLIEDKPDLFVKIASDKLLKTKVLLNTAVDLGLVKIRNSELFDADTDKPISEGGEASTIENAAAFLNMPRQQEHKLALQAKVKNSR